MSDVYLNGTRPHVLLLGWRSEAARALMDRGARVTCVGKPQHRKEAQTVAPEMPFLSARHPDNLDDCVGAFTRAGLSREDFDLACTGSEVPMVLAALLNRGASGIALRTAVALRDKAAQKECLLSKGIPTASWTVVDDLDALAVLHASGQDAVLSDFFRGSEVPSATAGVVIKPLAGGGARDTFRVRTASELADARERVSPEMKNGPWLVETFVEGTEYQVDGIVRDGRVRTLTVARYLENLIGVHDGAVVGTIVLRQSDHTRLYADARQLTASALEAIGHANGVFHLELFEQAERLVFGECAGRVSGGVVDLAVQHMFGVDLHEGWARALLALAPTDEMTDPKAVFAEIFLGCPPGTVLAVPSQSDVLVRPGVVDAFIDVAVGDRMPDMSASSGMRAAAAVVQGADEREVERRMYDLVSWFTSQCEVTD